MPGKIALVDFNKCHPEQCGEGVCQAAGACRYKLLKQEKVFEIPIADPFICRGCGDCARACPLQAVLIEII
jgi:translation initiation factor RLI1